MFGRCRRIKTPCKAYIGLYGGFSVIGLYFYAKCNITAITRNTGLIRAYAHVEEQLRKEAKERQSAGGGDKKSDKAKSVSKNFYEPIKPIRSAAEVAKKIGVSKNTYKGMKTIVNEGTEEQIKRMDKGKKTINPLRACEGVCKRFLCVTLIFVC